MRWQDLNRYDIIKEKDEMKKKEGYRHFFTYITAISSPICEELEKRGLHFMYSASTNKLTIQEMSDELKAFCEANGIDKQSRHRIVEEAFKKRK